MYAVNPKSTMRQELEMNFHERFRSAVFGHSNQVKKLKKLPEDFLTRSH